LDARRIFGGGLNARGTVTVIIAFPSEAEMGNAHAPEILLRYGTIWLKSRVRIIPPVRPLL